MFALGSSGVGSYAAKRRGLLATLHVAEAINALADAGRIVLGLDVRDYPDGDAFVEVSWSRFEPAGRVDDVELAREHALSALLRPDLPGTCFVVTW